MAEERGHRPEPPRSWADIMEETDTEVENIVEGMNGVLITYPFENWPAIEGPYNPTQGEGPQGPEAVDQVMNDHRNNPNLTNPGRDASVPRCLETFIQEMGDLPDQDVRMGTPDPQDDSDWTSTEHDSDEGRIPFDIMDEHPPHRDQECYFPGEESCHWVNMGKYPYTSYRCQPGDRVVVDIITGECRVVPSLSDTVYGDGNPPADGGLAPNEELVHQCPDDIPIGRELEGWA